MKLSEAPKLVSASRSYANRRFAKNEQFFRQEPLISAAMGGLTGGLMGGGAAAFNLGRAVIGSPRAGSVQYDGTVPGASIATRYITTEEAMNLLQKGGVKVSKSQAEILKKHHNRRAQLAHSIARAFGVNVQFGGVEKGALAQYDRSSNTIFLNPSEKVSVMKELAEGHELLHALEQTKNYEQLSDLVVNNIFGGTESNKYLSEAARIDALYKRMGKQLTEAELKQEIVAEYFRTKVFKNAKNLQQFITDNYKTLGQSFIESLKQTAAKVQQVFGKTTETETPSISQQVLDSLAVSMNQARTKPLSDRLDAIAEGYGLLEHSNSDTQNRRDVKFFANNSSEATSIKNQIRENLETINELEPVVDIKYQTGKSKKQVYDEVIKEFGKIGWKVDRQNFGVIKINPKDINTGLDYLNTQAEYAALYAVPKVLKRGEIIHQGEHKGRGHDTITIAAPVVINGTHGIVGVVVKQTKGNHYKTHRVLMPDGSMFEFNKNEEATTGWMTDDSTGESQPITSSNEILSQNNDDVKRQNLFTENSVKDAGVVDSGSERGLTVNMPDNKRAEILNNRSIPIISANTKGVVSLSNKEAVNKKITNFRNDVKKVLDDTGFFKGYENAELQLDAEYTGTSLRKSTNKNSKNTRSDFLILMDNFESVFKNAVVLDAITDKYAGTAKANPDLETAYTLISAFKTDDGITPVQFTVKTYKPKTNEVPKLYMGIALTKITDDSIVTAPLNLDGSTATAPLSSVNISISQLVEKINPSEGHFFKHMPDSMLTAEQIASKHTAEQEDFAKYGVKPRSERQSLITESSLKELENGYIPDEEFAEQARLEAASIPKSQLKLLLHHGT